MVDAINLNDPKMCINAILMLEETMKIPLDRKNTRILDFCVGNGMVGEMLSRKGFTEIHGIESNPRLAKRYLQSTTY